MAKQIVVTATSFQKLKEELDFLKNVKRKEAAEKVGEARSFGDLSENSEYDEARNEQAKIEAQILELEETIRNAKVIADYEVQTDVVGVGVTVLVYDFEFKSEIKYTLVSTREVDPMNNKISDLSPVGKKLVGAKVGDIVTVDVPDGIVKLEVRGIEKHEQ